MRRTRGGPRGVAVLAVTLLVVLAGCSAGVPAGGGDSVATQQDTEPGTATETELATGTVNFYISDERNAIDQFAHLNVTVSAVTLVRADGDPATGTSTANGTPTEAGNGTGTPAANDTAGNDTAADESADVADADGEGVTHEVDGVTVDLTELRGANATRLGAIGVPNGTYTGVVVHVESVEGTLADGSSAAVKLPSERLRLNKPFTVGNGQEVDFVFDVTVFERGKNGYVLRPVAGESGTGDEVEIRDVGRGSAVGSGGASANGSARGGAGAAGGGAGNGNAGAGNGANGNAGAGNAGAGDETNAAVDGEGRMAFYVSDERNAIDRFANLNATVTRVGVHRVGGANGAENGSADGGAWVERDVTATVDLTELQGATATKLAEFGLANGTYDNVFIHVESVEGTFTDGTEADVKLPSDRLKLGERFTVGDGQTVEFVFDLTVFERGPNGFIVRPVAGESGTGDEVPIDPVGADDGDGDDGDGDDETGTEDANGTVLNASFVGDVSLDANATVAVARNGTAVANATVRVTQHVDGERSVREYATDVDGHVTFRVGPNATELGVTVVDGDAEAELERTFDADGGGSSADGSGNGNGDGNGPGGSDNGNGNAAVRAALPR